MTADGLCEASTTIADYLGRRLTMSGPIFGRTYHSYTYSFLIGIASTGGTLNAQMHERPGEDTMSPAAKVDPL
jgi:hypothetical protein